MGDYEAHELRDGNASNYAGNSVHQAVQNVERIIGPELIKRRFNVGEDLAKIDRFMMDLDGSRNKARLGANAVLGVSMACARAGAAVKVCIWHLFFYLDIGGGSGKKWQKLTCGRASRCMSSCEKKQG